MECFSKDIRSEKEVAADGALLEFKKGGEPCNCRKHLFGFHIELTSSSFVSKHLTSMLRISYVIGCTDAQQRQRHILI